MPKRTQVDRTAGGSREATVCKSIWPENGQLGADSAASLEGAPPRVHELGGTYGHRTSVGPGNHKD